MSFVVIEAFGGPDCAIICTDESGNNLVFDNKEEAEKEAEDCQDGFVVEIYGQY